MPYPKLEAEVVWWSGVRSTFLGSESPLLACLGNDPSSAPVSIKRDMEALLFWTQPDLDAFQSLFRVVLLHLVLDAGWQMHQRVQPDLTTHASGTLAHSHNKRFKSPSKI